MVEFLKKYKVSIFLMTIFMTLYGTYSILTITREATPSINIPNYIVSIVYPGADSQTISEQVINKFEQKFKSISLIKNVNSTSANNIGIIMMEFSEKKSDVDATTDIKSAIDEIYPTLPEDVKYPTAKKIDINDQAIYSFAVAGPYPTEELYKKLKPLEDDIKGIAGVSDVQAIGKPIQEIKVMFDFKKIAELNLDFGMITSQLKNIFFKYPADKKELNGKLYSFEITNYEKDLNNISDEIKNYEIVNIGGKSIKIQDIASVEIGYESVGNKSFIVSNLAKKDTINAITFAVKKVPGADILKITENIKTRIDEFKKNHNEMNFVETISQQEEIQKIFDLFFENFFETGLLVFVIILVFLGWKSSIIISLGFFIVYLINFIFFKTIDYSFNNMISFSLILVLGIMVDNLIVITEGIVVGLKHNKENIWKAISHSLKNYGKAVSFGTLCTVAIFVPLYLGLSGIMGQFMKYMPVTIISNLLISLLVTMIILPILFVYAFGSRPKFQIQGSHDYLGKIGRKFADFYYRMNQKRIGTVSIILSFWIMLVMAFVAVGVGWIKVDFFGNEDSNNVWINIKYEPGVSLEQNQAYTDQISKDILGYINEKYGNIVRDITIDLGTDRSSNNISGALRASGGTSNISSFTIRLLDDKKRPVEVKSFEMAEDMNNMILKDVKSKYNFVEDIYSLTQKSGPGSGKPVGFYIVGDDYKKINEYINKILPEIKKIPGVYNLSTSIEYTNGKMKYIIDNNKLKQYNINNMSAVLTMLGLKNSSYYPNGIKIHEFNEFGDETIQANAFLGYTGNIDNIKVGNVYLSQLIKEKRIEPDLLSIEKTDGELAIMISADKKSDAVLNEIVVKIKDTIKDNPMPDGLKYKESGDIETQATSTRELGLAIVSGIALMFLVLILQFNNFKYATVIITSILLSLSGSLFILGIFGLSFDFVAQLGVFGVLGVGVNQALIHLEDFKEFYEQDGLSVIDSFRKSIALRFIPIFLTKSVTVIGLVILAFKDEFFRTLATAFIGGLIVSFFITLFYIPSLMKAISPVYYKRKEE